MKSIAQPKITKFMTLAEAGDIWLSGKKQKLSKPKTLECCKTQLTALLNFLGNPRLHEINAGSLVAYQTRRSEDVCPSSVNHELNALQQILRQALCWGQISDSYHPLKEPEWQKPTTLTHKEQQAIFAEATADHNLQLVEIAFSIMRNTGIGSCELRRAQRRDLDLESVPSTFHVTGGGTEFDTVPRVIPLNTDAKAAFSRAVERADRLGSRYPGHFIFPYRVNRALWDPSRPASRGWLRKQMETLRERTGIQHLNSEVWRDQLCTEMLKQGIPIAHIVALLGHVSEKMVEAYKHTRLESKQAALGVLERSRRENSFRARGVLTFPSAARASRMAEPDQTGDIA
jgi:integrase